MADSKAVDSTDKTDGQVPAGEAAAASESGASSTDATPPSPTPATAAADEAGSAAHQTDAGEKPAPEAPKTPKADWREDRIRVLTAKLREAEAKAAAKAEAQGDEPPERATEAEINARARQLAQQQTAKDAFDRACMEADAKGKKDFPEDWAPRVSELRKLVGDGSDTDTSMKYAQMIAAALETGEAPKIIHALGGDLDEANRIMNLPPVRQAVELTKLAMRDPAASAISGAPKPITPVGGKGPAHTQISASDPSRADNLSSAEWHRRRNAEIAARNGAAAR